MYVWQSRKFARAPITRACRRPLEAPARFVAVRRPVRSGRWDDCAAPSGGRDIKDVTEPDGLRPSRGGGWRRVLLTGALALALALVTPGTGVTEERDAARVLSWEAATRKSFFIPALEIGGF